MNYADQEAALERAAAPALAAIEEDSRRAPEWLRPLFAASRELLFYPDLELDQIQQAAGFADAEVWNVVREEVGQPAWNYLRDARLETAAHLLLTTEMSIAEVGHLVGYTSGPSFRRLLGGFLGMPPSRLRRSLAEGLLETLDPTHEPQHVVIEDGERKTMLAAAEESFMLPFADQRRLVRDAVLFPDGTHFEALSERSAQADPERGVELAPWASTTWPRAACPRSIPG